MGGKGQGQIVPVGQEKDTDYVGNCLRLRVFGLQCDLVVDVSGSAVEQGLPLVSVLLGVVHAAAVVPHEPPGDLLEVLLDELHAGEVLLGLSCDPQEPLLESSLQSALGVGAMNVPAEDEVEVLQFWLRKPLQVAKHELELDQRRGLLDHRPEQA